MASVRTVSLPDGSTFTMSDWGDYPLWSRAEIDPYQAQDVIIFNYVQSQTIPGGGSNNRATLVDTNLPTAGQLPLRHQMVIFSVQVRFDEARTDSSKNGVVSTSALNGNQEPTHAEGLRKWSNIAANYIFQLVVEGSKPYVEGPLTAFPAGGGLYMLNGEENTTPPTVQAYNINNGEPKAGAARRLSLPIHLGALESFQGFLKLPRGAMGNWTTSGASTMTDFGITVTLSGPRQRPIG